MTQAATFAQNLTAAAFVALGIATAIQWRNQRGRAAGLLALSLVALGLVAAMGRLQAVLPPSAFLTLLSLVAFMASGYFILLFRGEFVPLSRWASRAAASLLIVAAVLSIIEVTWLSSAPAGVRMALTVALILIWSAFTGEPIVRFWLASNTLPAVQKARMRSLSFGFAVLIVLLLVSVIGGGALQSPVASLVIQLVALSIVPVIYVSFAPPAVLRRLWRMGEEAALRSAMLDLLIFSPTRQVLAERAAGWAARLVGATGAFIVDSDGKVMATYGMDEARAREILAARGSREKPVLESAARSQIIAVPLPLPDNPGLLAVVGGRFTPVFGSDELTQLSAYAGAVTAGLERAKVTERMASIERNKTQFLNLASHELRGPITVIRGYVSMLETGMLGKLNDRGKAAVDVMEAKVLEMNELIEQMIEAARLEDGGLMLKPVEADLREIARAAMRSARPLAEGTHELVFTTPDRRVRVKVDPERTQTIISNLISNAIKYSPGGGEVTCEVRVRPGVARVVVKDQGLGIAREHMATLFTRFGRIVTPETEHLQGTGLGLYLARQLARLQGGDITVESVAGEGSTFTLHLPAYSRADMPVDMSERMQEAVPSGHASAEGEAVPESARQDL